MPSAGGAPVPINPFSDWKKTCMPAGRWFATAVGIPMPRLTSMPGLSSRAILRAMMSCGAMRASRIGDEVIDQRRRRPDVIRGDQPDRNDIFGARDHGAGRERDNRIEVARRERIAQVAEIVREERLYEGEVGTQRELEQIALAVQVDPLL